MIDASKVKQLAEVSRSAPDPDSLTHHTMQDADPFRKSFMQRSKGEYTKWHEKILRSGFTYDHSVTNAGGLTTEGVYSHPDLGEVHLGVDDYGSAWLKQDVYTADGKFRGITSTRITTLPAVLSVVAQKKQREEQAGNKVGVSGFYSRLPKTQESYMIDALKVKQLVEAQQINEGGIPVLDLRTLTFRRVSQEDLDRHGEDLIPYRSASEVAKDYSDEKYSKLRSDAEAFFGSVAEVTQINKGGATAGSTQSQKEGEGGSGKDTSKGKAGGQSDQQNKGASAPAGTKTSSAAPHSEVEDTATGKAGGKSDQQNSGGAAPGSDGTSVSAKDGEGGSRGLAGGQSDQQNSGGASAPATQSQGHVSAADGEGDTKHKAGGQSDQQNKGRGSVDVHLHEPALTHEYFDGGHCRLEIAIPVEEDGVAQPQHGPQTGTADFDIACPACGEAVDIGAAEVPASGPLKLRCGCGHVWEEDYNMLEAKYGKKETEPYNPWAVCTASCGRDNKAKYKRCTDALRKQNRKAHEAITAPEWETIEQAARFWVGRDNPDFAAALSLPVATNESVATMLASVPTDLQPWVLDAYMRLTGSNAD